MSFQSPNQQCQSTEGRNNHSPWTWVDHPKLTCGPFNLVVDPIKAPGYLGRGLPSISSKIWRQWINHIGRAKMYPLQIFADFFNNHRNLLNKIWHTSYAINYSQTLKVLLLYVQNWQNYAAFNRGNLTFNVVKDCLTLIAFKTSANTVSVNIFWVTAQQMLKRSSSSLHVLSQSLSETRNSFVLRKIFPFFLQCSPVFQKLYCIWLRIELSKSFMYRSPDMISAEGSNLES